MKYPKIFIAVLFIVSFFLFLTVLPKPLEFTYKTPSIPFLKIKSSSQKVSLDFSAINFDTPVFQFKRNLEYKLGLDLQGGARIVYGLDMSKIAKNERQNAFEAARDIIERRINFFGVSEPLIQTIKNGEDYRIAIELPGVTDVTTALDLIGKTAQLSFWEGSNDDINPKAATSSAYPFGMSQVFSGKKPIKTDLTGKDLKSVKVVYGQQTVGPQVQLNFTSSGKNLFAEITKRNVNKRVAIVLDDEVVEAPEVRSAIVDGTAVIEGRFTPETAKNLAIALNAGALPVPLRIIAQTNVGPSLGIESLNKSLLGGIMGFLSIVIFMIYLYRKEGTLACVALGIYSIIVLFIFKFIPISLTLAGIAGFILSIGMAVDANILIFERMKEEKRSGKSQPVAIEVGFYRAWSSIRDSNISSLITALILFIFGTGIVRGFAVTLAIGILVSMFSAITVTRNLLRVFDKK